MSLGLISHQPGRPTAVPNILRGAPRRVIDTLCTGADDSIDSAATHVVDGVSWVVTTDTADTATATASGIRVASSSGTLWVMTTEIPEFTASDLVCVSVEFALTTMGTNGQSIQVRLGSAADGTTSTAEDITATFRKTGSSTWRPRPGQYTGSSYSMSYIGDNPWATSLPSRLVIQLIGHGNTWKVRYSTADGRPTHNSLTPENNGHGRIRSGSAGTVGGSDPVLLKYLRIVLGPNNGDLDVTVTGVRVTVCGGG